MLQILLKVCFRFAKRFCFNFAKRFASILLNSSLESKFALKVALKFALKNCFKLCFEIWFEISSFDYQANNLSVWPITKCISTILPRCWLERIIILRHAWWFFLINKYHVWSYHFDSIAIPWLNNDVNTFRLYISVPIIQ